MIFGILESFNDAPLLLYLVVIATACIGGGQGIAMVIESLKA